MKNLLYPLAITLPSLVFSCPSGELYHRSVATSADSIADKTFDYIIAGGGVTGLTVASRLSEDPNITVLVIEAGNNNHHDPRVYDVRTYGEAFGSDLDYDMVSTPIPWRNNESMLMVAGKTLGGSGSINGASWTKGPKTQYDLLPYLTGDESWGFDAFNAKMLRAEHFNPPSAELVAKGAQYDAAFHGENGPVQVSFAQGMFGSIELPALQASQIVWNGLQLIKDTASGIVNGVTTIPNMLQPDASQNRSDSYTAYIQGEPETRRNLFILIGHRATRILWKSGTTDANAALEASGVEFQASRNSPVLTANARREVLLAAGAMQSPQLLELSGIGDPSVLSVANIPVVRALSGVGKNLQEQTKSTLTYTPFSTNFNGSGPPSTIAFPNVYQLLGNTSSATYAYTLASLPAYATALEKDGLVANGTATLDILRHQLYNLFNQSEAASEIFFDLNPASGTVGADIWNLIVMARGTIHIATNNSWDLPIVNPAYFRHPLDLHLQTLSAMQTRDVYNTVPLSALVSTELVPGFDAVPENASYEVWESWVKRSFTSVWHPIATLSCMRKGLGGVVDSRLRVYGLANVRVVDASVLPVQLSAHLSSSLFGIAEKAAEMIREDQKEM